MIYKFLITLFATGCFSVQGQPVISFTFDDGITNDMPGHSFEQWNDMILLHLEQEGVKAVFFVTGNNKSDQKGKWLLNSWNDQGHRIANHTFNHPNYNRKDVTFEQFKIEFLMTDSLIRKYSNYLRMFRFPFLKEGDTREKIDSFRALLSEHKYRNGYVTIDASDWYIDSRLRKKLQKNPNEHIEKFEQYYLKHLYDRAMYYEKISWGLTGRHIKHTLLLHHNLVSALFLGKAMKMFKEKGWVIMDADKAFDDEIYKKQPTNVPAGEGLIWALAKESGRFASILRYPAEDSEYEKVEMDRLGL
jgi:peptidoglycan-N-acetylglucosamine deacetylase